MFSRQKWIECHCITIKLICTAPPLKRWQHNIITIILNIRSNTLVYYIIHSQTVSPIAHHENTAQCIKHVYFGAFDLVLSYNSAQFQIWVQSLSPTLLFQFDMHTVNNLTSDFGNECHLNDEMSYSFWYDFYYIQSENKTFCFSSLALQRSIWRILK